MQRSDCHGGSDVFCFVLARSRCYNEGIGSGHSTIGGVRTCVGKTRSTKGRKEGRKERKKNHAWRLHVECKLVCAPRSWLPHLPRSGKKRKEKGKKREIYIYGNAAQFKSVQRHRRLVTNRYREDSLPFLKKKKYIHTYIHTFIYLSIYTCLCFSSSKLRRALGCALVCERRRALR